MFGLELTMRWFIYFIQHHRCLRRRGMLYGRTMDIIKMSEVMVMCLGMGLLVWACYSLVRSVWLHVRSLGVAGYQSSGEGGVCLSPAGFRGVSFRFLGLGRVRIRCEVYFCLLLSDYFSFLCEA